MLWLRRSPRRLGHCMHLGDLVRLWLQSERRGIYIRMRMLPGGAEKMFPTRSVIIAIVGWLAYETRKLMPRLGFSGAAGSVPRGRCWGDVEARSSRPSLPPLRNTPPDVPFLDLGSGNSVPGKCRSVKSMLPVELLSLASESIFPHMAKGALPRISFRCPRPLTGQSLVELIMIIKHRTCAMPSCRFFLPATYFERR